MGRRPCASIWIPRRAPPHHLQALQRVLVSFCVPILSLAVNLTTTAAGPGQESCSHDSVFVRRIPFPWLACTVHPDPLWEKILFSSAFILKIGVVTAQGSGSVLCIGG